MGDAGALRDATARSADDGQLTEGGNCDETLVYCPDRNCDDDRRKRRRQAEAGSRKGLYHQARHIRSAVDAHQSQSQQIGQLVRAAECEPIYGQIRQGRSFQEKPEMMLAALVMAQALTVPGSTDFDIRCAALSAKTLNDTHDAKSPEGPTWGMIMMFYKGRLSIRDDRRDWAWSIGKVYADLPPDGDLDGLKTCVNYYLHVNFLDV